MASMNQSPASKAYPQQTIHMSRAALSLEQKRQLEWLQTRMRKVKNQMDFIEIISNFLPGGLVDNKVDQLDKEMRVLNQQYANVLTVKTPFQAS